MEEALQERQQDLGAQSRFAASSSAVHNDGHEDMSRVEPRLAQVRALWEGPLQAADEKSNTLELFLVDLVRPCWRRAPLLAASNEHPRYMRRAA